MLCELFLVLLLAQVNQLDFKLILLFYQAEVVYLALVLLAFLEMVQMQQ